MHPRLVPELICSDIANSLDFYVRVLGFAIVHQRPEERFAYLDREGAELMLEQPTSRRLAAGELEPPYGRGINLQIEVANVDALYEAVQRAGAQVFLPLEERWYRRRDGELATGSSSCRTRMVICCASSKTSAHARPVSSQPFCPRPHGR
jgi:catechol 2,3-dioxygenase-like lactoylglutathione lyase family enzyme